MGLLLLSAPPLAADGPETGVVTGTVTEPGGAALPGVEVKLVSERGEKLTQTADDGTFRFALLVPDSYLVKVEIEGLGAAERAVEVTAGERSDVALALKLEAAETITVAAEAPIVDKFNVTAGATITSEVGAQAAVGEDGATKFFDAGSKSLVLPKDGGMSWYVSVPDKAKLTGDLSDGACTINVIRPVGTRSRRNRPIALVVVDNPLPSTLTTALAIGWPSGRVTGSMTALLRLHRRLHLVVYLLELGVAGRELAGTFEDLEGVEPLAEEEADATAFVSGGEARERLTDLCHVLLNSNEFIYVD